MKYVAFISSTANSSKGFTLIEMVLALSLFSLILLMGYQAIASTSQSSKRLSAVTEQQQELRATFRSLDNAFKSMAPLKGDRFNVEFNLSDADSPWLSGSKFIRFNINTEQELWAFLDEDPIGTLLSANMTGAEFTFHSKERVLSAWDSSKQPQAMELSWLLGEERLTWRFED